ncbi:hypothetical protein PUN28_018157 [Cardiocondyla obscurior]|uniref:Secreted protein n=1 Tax=Cardiocondyla obscurior TaxID=286306 RepID=A0AAW2EKS0_9HYME
MPVLYLYLSACRCILHVHTQLVRPILRRAALSAPPRPSPSFSIVYPRVVSYKIVRPVIHRSVDQRRLFEMLRRPNDISNYSERLRLFSLSETLFSAVGQLTRN